jgi:putative transposase
MSSIPSDRAVHPLRLEILPGTVAVHVDRLVLHEGGPEDGFVQVRDLANGAPLRVRLKDLRAQPSVSESELNRRMELVHERSDGEWQRALDNFELLQQLLDENGTLDQRVHKAAAARGVASRTIYRWLERFRRIAQPSSLLGFRPGPAKGLHILDAERERIVREVINGSYLKLPRARVEGIYREIGLRCTSNGLQPVARNTIRARIKALDPRLVARKRYGAKHARATAESAAGTFAVDAGLAVVQIDHTVADVNVVDETFRKPIGRPWLTLAVDVHTRMICGFHVSLNPPSQLSVALCLTHAVLAKDGWLAERHLDLNWPAAGLMKSLHSDNGRDLHGKGLEMGSREWGIQWVFRPPATPHFGGHIERLIGTVMGAVHLLPGTTYSNTQERGNYASEEAATLSMAELESWLAIQICEG